MHIEENPYEGIIFYPDAKPETRFGATVGHVKRAKIVGYFSTLQEAIDARKSALHSRQEIRTA